jgi:hypothetical protein
MKSKVDGSNSTQRNLALQILRDLVTDEFICSICLGTCTDTNINPQCGHRFCKLCIKKSLNKCKHECPICRTRIPTCRTLRHDAQFDRIVSAERCENTFIVVGNTLSYCISLNNELPSSSNIVIKNSRNNCGIGSKSRSGYY